MVNWSAVGIGFVVTVILEVIGTLFKTLDISVSFFISIFAPIIGGLIAAYWADGQIKDGAVNGAIAGGMGSFIAAIIFLQGDIAYIAVNSIISLISSAILGIIGGIIGILARGKPKSDTQEELENDF